MDEDLASVESGEELRRWKLTARKRASKRIKVKKKEKAREA